MDVAAWLQDLGFERYARNFEENHIDAEVLLSLDEADLKELGVWSLGHRRKLMAAIAALGSTASASPAIPDDVRRVVRPPARRQVAALAVVQRAGADATERILAILADYGGDIAAAGSDGLTATFGSATDTEGQIVRAILAAEAIENAVIEAAAGSDQEMVVAMGLDGDQVSEDEASTSIGSIVSLARAIASGSPGGAISASKAVVDASGDRFRWLPGGETGSSAQADPVRAWQLERVRRRPAGIRQAPFAGREDELRHFRRMVDICRSRGHSQGVMLLGGAGIGKSRLIEELAAMATGEGFQRIAVHGDGVAAHEAGDAVTMLTAALLEVPSGAEAQHFDEAIDRAIDAGTLDPMLRAGVNDIMCLHQDGESRAVFELLDADGHDAIRRAALRALFRMRAAAGPVLLTIDDLHLAGSRAVAQLADLVRDLEDQPVIFAATARKEEPAPLQPEWIAALQHAGARTIQLDALSREEAETMAAGYGEASSAEVAKRINLAGGSTAYLEQLLIALASGRTEVATETMESLIQDRVQSFEPRDRRALQAVAVIGQCVPLGVLRAMLEDPGYDPAPLIAERLFDRNRDLVLFAQQSIRAVVYNGIDRDDRQDLHALAARVFAGKDNTLTARHLERAHDSTAPRVYAQAAETHLAELRPARALALVRRALKIVSSDEDRCVLSHREGDCLTELGQDERAGEAYQRALDCARSDSQSCRAQIGIARGFGRRGLFAEALEQLTAARSVAEKSNLERELASIHNLEAQFSAPVDRIHRAHSHYSQALSLARRAAMPEEIIRASRGLAEIAEAGCRMAEARTHFANATETARTHGLVRLAVESDVAAVRCRYYLDPLPEVLDHVLSTVNSAARIGHDVAEAEAHLVAAAVLDDLGKFDLVLEHFDRAQDIGERANIARFEPALASFAARALVASGQRDDARDLLGAALKMMREFDPAGAGGVVLGAVVLHARGRKTREGAFAEAEELLGGGASCHSHLRFYRDAVDAALSVGDPDLAMHFMSRLEGYVQGNTLPWADFLIARGKVLATVGTGRAEPSVSRELRQLIDEAKRMGYVWATTAMRVALDDLRRGGGVPNSTGTVRQERVVGVGGEVGPGGRPMRRRS